MKSMQEGVNTCCIYKGVNTCGVVVIILAFQASDSGSIPDRCKFFLKNYLKR